jgi:type IV pilus assembly protein PilB
MNDIIYKIQNTSIVLHDISSIIELIDAIIAYGYHRNASDIHIDPSSEGVVIRYRIDGVLGYADTIKDESHEEMISRIKVLASLRTDIHFTPQDGRFKFTQGLCDCDIRVSIIPTHYGENAVLRILRNDEGTITLENLGFSDHDIDRIKYAISQNQGMILVTGPTGSGKTSTLYSIISMLSSMSNSIITLEDPIEYSISGVRQIQIHTKHGITFANGLRSIVRQDPDIIMVGEIRDTETAQIATNISLTGHLLLSTLHTNSAIGAIPRLLDMKIDPYLIASTLTLIVAQRLVRKLCQKCKGIGCGFCGAIGYKGRTVISETVLVDEEMRAYINSQIPLKEINTYARNKGMITMYEDGMEKVDKGITTREEILRVLHD